MRILLIVLSLLPALLGPASPGPPPATVAPGQDRVLPSRVPLPTSGLAVHGDVRPAEQIDAPGRRAAWIGNEGGSLEAWVYPLKVLRDLRLSFLVGNALIEGTKVARRVEVRPEWTTITYVHEAFTVRQVIATPVDAPALLSLLEIDTSVPLTVEVQFHVDLHPMWPAGLGGQFSSWDAGLPGFVLGEGRRANAAIVMSPAAVDPTVQPAHSLPDLPTRFRMHVVPGEASQRWYPIVVAAWTHGMDDPGDPATMIERARQLAADPLPALQALVDHYRNLASRTVRVRTPVRELDEALAWASVRLHQGLVCNPHLGCGLVAGYGGSGAGYRPGFAWFFGGDSFYNSWALTALGANDTVRMALQMLADNQRADGKIMHELSQGAGTLRWFEDYPYGFYHAETTPYFIDAVVRHAVATGDLDWTRTLWPHVQLALAYCLGTDTDGDGLMENAAAGLGAVEMGALRELRVHQDIYLAAVWARAATALAPLADALGDVATAATAREVAARAVASLESRFGIDDGGWAFALAGDGSRVEEPTVWNLLPAALGVGDPARAQRALRAAMAPDIATDWGTRMLSSRSPLYDPLVYNQGTVWPFLTGFAAMAAYRHGQSAAGEDLLDGLVRLTTSHSRGAIHEVLSGDRFAPMQASVPHQLFSTASLVTPLLGGLFGIEIDRLAGTLVVSPQLPYDWEEASITGLAWGASRIDLRLRRSRAGMELTADLFGHAGPPPALTFAPWLPAGAVPDDTGMTRADAAPAAPADGCRSPGEAASLRWEPREGGWSASGHVSWSGGLPFALRGARAVPGDRSLGLRVIGCRATGESLTLDVAGVPGSTYTLLTPDAVQVVAEGLQAIRRAPGTWDLAPGLQDPAVGRRGDSRDGYVVGRIILSR